MLNADALQSHRFERLEQSYMPDQTILYALGVGLGSDPTDEFDLDFLIESRGKILPTYAATLASPGMWIRDPAFGVDFTRLVHSQQAMTFHHRLPASATVCATPRIAGLFDRGSERGAVVVIERQIADAETGIVYATASQTLLLRGDGGFGGAPPPFDAQVLPERRPDREVAIKVSSRAALIYRLSGDRNPLHCEPDFARQAGMERPIMHGLAIYGMAGQAIIRTFGATLESLSCRFAGIVYPGDQLRFQFWIAGSDVKFIASVGERLVLDRGVSRMGGYPHPSSTNHQNNLARIETL